jgi:hypothetical protein
VGRTNGAPSTSYCFRSPTALLCKKCCWLLVFLETRSSRQSSRAYCAQCSNRVSIVRTRSVARDGARGIRQTARKQLPRVNELTSGWRGVTGSSCMGIRGMCLTQHEQRKNAHQLLHLAHQWLEWQSLSQDSCALTSTILLRVTPWPWQRGRRDGQSRLRRARCAKAPRVTSERHSKKTVSMLKTLFLVEPIGPHAHSLHSRHCVRDMRTQQSRRVRCCCCAGTFCLEAQKVEPIEDQPDTSCRSEAVGVNIQQDNQS